MNRCCIWSVRSGGGASGRVLEVLVVGLGVVDPSQRVQAGKQMGRKWEGNTRQRETTYPLGENYLPVGRKLLTRRRGTEARGSPREEGPRCRMTPDGGPSMEPPGSQGWIRWMMGLRVQEGRAGPDGGSPIGAQGPQGQRVGGILCSSSAAARVPDGAGALRHGGNAFLFRASAASIMGLSWRFVDELPMPLLILTSFVCR